MKTDLLYYGDNLEILRRYIPDESVDLVYLDPPFNSNRDYNVIFKDESGRKSDAQLLAFEDTWHWGPDAESQYAYLTQTARNQGRVPSTVSTIVAALRSGIGENQMMAYLVEMAVRLAELHRVLKPTGSVVHQFDKEAVPVTTKPERVSHLPGWDDIPVVPHDNWTALFERDVRALLPEPTLSGLILRACRYGLLTPVRVLRACRSLRG
jgi:hypothetical protein